MQYLVFTDLDGTLEDSRQDMLACVHRVRQELGLPRLPDSLVLPHVNKGMDHLYRHCFSDYLGSSAEAGRYDVVRTRYEADYLAHVAVETRLYPGIAGFLAEVSAFAKIVVVTNKPEKISWALLQALGVSEHIALIMGGDSCPENKPSPLPLRTAVRALQCEDDFQALMMGDSTADIETAQAFGIPAIWCAWGYLDSLVGYTSHYTAKSPHELAGIVAQVFQTRARET